MNLVIEIDKALGPRKKNLTQDQYQIFWVGVLKAMKDVDQTRDMMPYLMMRGFGEVKNQRRAEHSIRYYKYCPECNQLYGFRATECKTCKCELELEGRQVEFIDHHDYAPDPTDRIMMEQFIETLDGRKKYVAKRWLIDRADLIYENHSKQLAFELDISAPAISSIKRKIKQKFLEWYHR